MIQPFTLSVTVPASGWLTANQRLHHHAKASRVREWRQAGAWAVKVNRAPKLERAHITAVLRFHDGRRRDALNWCESVKPALDGTVDAGLLPDDDRLHLEGPDLRIGDTLPRSERLRIDFVITPLEAL